MTHQLWNIKRGVASVAGQWLLDEFLLWEDVPKSVPQGPLDGRGGTDTTRIIGTQAVQRHVKSQTSGVIWECACKQYERKRGVACENVPQSALKTQACDIVCIKLGTINVVLFLGVSGWNHDLPTKM